MDLPPPRPPRRLNARLFSTETCAHTPRQVHWDGATWLLNIYSSHLSESLVTASVKLKYKRAVPVSVLEVHLKGTGQISTRCKLYLHTVDCEEPCAGVGTGTVLRLSDLRQYKDEEETRWLARY